MSSTVLSARGISKSFGPTVALDGVSVEFHPGEVHALMGANGSGKSTLTKTLVGVVRPDEGGIWSGDRPLERGGAGAQRVVAVFQETSLIPGMSVEDNIWLTREPRSFFGVDRRALREQTDALIALIADVAPSVKADVLVGGLGPDSRQLVELLKSISRNPQFIILDEATASLDARQARRVAELVGKWRQEGRGVILVTHRMHEAFSLADTISVLRNGRLMLTGQRRDLDEARVVELMVGVAGESAAARAKPAIAADAPTLSATVDIGGEASSFALNVRGGEIVGLGGLQGQGQARVLRGIFSGDADIADIVCNVRKANIRQPADAVSAGLAFVPGDRNRDGLFKGLSVTDNAMSASWRGQARAGWLNLRLAHRLVGELVARLRIKAASVDVAVSTLSGGNAQKVVLARWLARRPSFLLLDDPTKGIDVNARADFYEALEQARDAGMGILIYSSDENELARLCDRVLVMLEGRLVASLSGAELEPANIARAGLVGQHHG